MRIAALPCLLVVLSLSLAGCGGGGGNRAVADALEPVENETLPPSSTPLPSPEPPATFAHHITGLGDQAPLTVAPLPGGGFLVGGHFLGGAHFRRAEADETLLDQLGAGIFDAFLARYEADGTLAWVRSIPSAQHVGVEHIVALADGSFVVAGTFERVTIFGFGEPEETVLTTPDDLDDLFLARYEADGRLRWVRQDGGVDAFEELRDMDAWPNGALVVTGYFGSTTTLGRGDATETKLEGPAPSTTSWPATRPTGRSSGRGTACVRGGTSVRGSPLCPTVRWA